MASILVVDDERGMRTTLQRFLESEGYVVTTASDALEALQQLGRQSFDIVVSDIIMPRVGGIDLLKTLKSSHQDTKVIMITGEPTINSISESFRIGAFDYLSKPFNRSVLLRTVERALTMRQLEIENRRYKENLERMVEDRTAELVNTNRRMEREIAERRQAVEALKASETRFRQLAELLPEIVYEMDATGLLTFVNRASFAKTGYTEEDYRKGLNGFDLFPPDEQARLRKSFIRYLTGQDTTPHEYTARRKDGTLFPILARSTPIVSEGKPVGLRGIFLDISDRKKTEEELRRAEREKSVILDAMSDSVMFLDANKNVIWANRAATDALNLPVEAFKERNYPDIWPRDTGRQETCSVALAMETLSPQGHEIQYDDGSIWRVDAYPVLDDNGKLLGVVDMRREVTAQKRAEQKLQEYQIRLRALASELALSEERERQKIARELHDHIGQILALAKIKLGLLIKNLPGETHQAQASEVFELVTRMVQHVQRLTFELSSLQIYDGDWRAALEELVRELFDPNVHSVEIDITGEEFEVDPSIRTILYRSVRELFYNIFKHAGPCPVFVTFRFESPWITVVVRDHGVGFDVEEFESRPIEARHFGLFSVSERVEFAGGTFLLDSSPGEGVCVTLKIPVGHPGDENRV